jgi:hypothetical protein
VPDCSFVPDCYDAFKSRIANVNLCKYLIDKSNLFADACHRYPVELCYMYFHLMVGLRRL